MIIAIMSPFKFQALTLEYRLASAVFLGLLCSGTVLAVVNMLRTTFPSWTNEEGWTVGKEIMLFLAVLFAICLNVFWVLLLLDVVDGPIWQIFKHTVLYTIVISLFPIVIVVLYEQYSHQKKQLIKAREINALIDSPQSGIRQSTKEEKVVFAAENGKTELQLELMDILYLESGGNYVEVFYFDHHQNVQKKLIRNRLKVLQTSLPQKVFFQSHRRFIVNTTYITRIDGNARNFELTLRSIDTPLPVSRSKSEEVFQFLQN